MMNERGGPLHVDCFSAVDVPKGRRGDYTVFRAAALKAGRFSVWEASDNPGMFNTLCRDPDIITDTSCGFPWTDVRLRAQPQPDPSHD